MVSRQFPSVNLVLHPGNYTFATGSIGVFLSADEVPSTVVFDQSTNTWSDECFISAYYPALHEDNIQVPLYHWRRSREEAVPTVPIGIREEAGPIVPLGKKS